MFTVAWPYKANHFSLQREGRGGEEDNYVGAGLIHGEEMHQSRILGEWSNTIGYKVGSSPTMVYTTVKTYLEVKFLGQPHLFGQETWPLENPNWRQLFLFSFSILSAIVPPIASNSMVLALLHYSLNCP
jgi:hypothetical protein